MSFRNLSREDLISGSTRIAHAGLENGKKAVTYINPTLEKSTVLATQAANWSAQNPMPAACVAVSTAGVAVVAAPGLVSAPLLSSMGFTAGGIQAGSAAAAVHSWTGNIVAGSAMAVGQSAGAGGAGLAVVNGTAQMVGGAMTLGSAGLAWMRNREVQTENDVQKEDGPQSAM